MWIKTGFGSKSAIAIAVVGLAGCAPPSSDQSAPVQACPAPDAFIGSFVTLPAGRFTKGAAPVYPEEAPTEERSVQGFQIQVHEVTNAQYAAFVSETGYVTEVERGVSEGRLGAGSAVFVHPTETSDQAGEWQLDASADWRHPDGGESDVSGAAHHPVVNLTLQDAAAYASWAGGRLPSETEWEYAASLGLHEADDPTSGAYSAEGPRANTWQGIFPFADLGTDGFQNRAPVGCFEPDRIGLYDMIGNVWEWTSTPYAAGTQTIKGGSFLCANNFCRRYRPAARQPQEADFSSNHIGFRIVRDLPPEPASE